MNGIGIVGTLKRLPVFFKQLDKILAPGGQVLCDSSDISCVFDGDIPDDIGYYGEQNFLMQYKDTIGEPFDWLNTCRNRDAYVMQTVEVQEGKTRNFAALCGIAFIDITPCQSPCYPI